MDNGFRTELEKQINKMIDNSRDLKNDDINTNKSIYLFITDKENNDFGLIEIYLTYILKTIFTNDNAEDTSKGNIIPVIVCNIDSMRSKKISSFDTVNEKFGDIYSEGTSNRLIKIIEEKIKSFNIIDNLDDLSKYYLNTLKYNKIKSTLSSIFEKDTIYYDYFFLNNENNKDYFNLSIKYSK